jgi:hypothetical protein
MVVPPSPGKSIKVRRNKDLSLDFDVGKSGLKRHSPAVAGLIFAGFILSWVSRVFIGIEALWLRFGPVCGGEESIFQGLKPVFVVG